MGAPRTEILVYIVFRDVEHFEVALVRTVTFQDFVTDFTLVPNSLVY